MKALLCLVALLAFDALAQEPPFPQRAPLEITVLFPAGSSADLTARLLADGLERHLGSRFALGRNVAFANTGALPDPLVRRVDHL